MRNIILITLALAATTSLFSESLWNSKRNSETSMFADRLATSIGDILSVMVDESTIVSRSASKNTSSSSNLKSGITSFLYPSSGFGSHGGELPRINISPSSGNSGEGSYSDTNIVEARIAVVVYDLRPNGDLLIEGARKIKSNGETQYMVLRGIVRRDDVMVDNSVMSYNILNANVELLSEGDLNTAQRKNFINQAFDAINIL